MQETIVTYPAGAEREKAEITGTYRGEDGDGLLIVTDVTPFHPVDPWWPDQPSDRGLVLIDGKEFEVLRAVLVGVGSETGEIRLGDVSGIKRADESWRWFVGHHVRGLSADLVGPGTSCELVVDHSYRAAISVGHTGCHIAALALNAVLNPFWRKEAEKDSWGHFDFDQMAMETSRIGEYESTDDYRVGKSLRKRGFQPDEFWRRFDSLAPEVTKIANEIVQGGGAITVAPSRTRFHDRRTWQIEYRGMQIKIPCGGVHPEKLSEIRRIEIQLVKGEPDGTMRMNTKTIPVSL